MSLLGHHDDLEAVRIEAALGERREREHAAHATIVGIDPAFGSSMMVLRTARAPRLQAGHVGDSKVRNRASPLCALNATRTAARVEAAVRSTSGALAFGFCAVGADCSGVDFLESHPSTDHAIARAKSVERMPGA